MGNYWCKTCSIFVDEYSKKKHEQSSKHLRNVQATINKIKEKADKLKSEQKLAEELIAQAISKEDQSGELSKGKSNIDSNKQPLKNTYGYESDSKIKVKKSISIKSANEPKSPLVGAWAKVESSPGESIPQNDKKISGMIPLSINKRKINASEKEIKEWDLGTDDHAHDVDLDADGEDLEITVTKPKFAFKKRKVIKKI